MCISLPTLATVRVVGLFAGIMTHHVGYTLLFEQALHVVDPAVSIPYWEYTIECKIAAHCYTAVVAPASRRLILISQRRRRYLFSLKR